MSLDIVGRENIPNIYIKEVSIENYNSGNLIVSPILYLKDLKDTNSRFQWYENKHLRNNMKILVVVSSSPVFNEAIKTNDYANGFTSKTISK